MENELLGTYDINDGLSLWLGKFAGKITFRITTQEGFLKFQGIIPDQYYKVEGSLIMVYKK